MGSYMYTYIRRLHELVKVREPYCPSTSTMQRHYTPTFQNVRQKDEPLHHTFSKS